MTPAINKTSWPAGGLVLSGLAVIVLLLGGIVAWAAIAEISGAVIAAAELRVAGRQATVQHLEGGIVAETFVKDGDHIAAGSPLLRMDGTALTASLEIHEHQLDELLAREARLQAEQQGADQLVVSPRLAQRMSERENARTLTEGQTALFHARLDAHAQRIQQNVERIAQARNQIDGIQAQIESYNSQRQLVAEALQDQNALLAKGLTTRTRVSALEREDAQLAGQLGTARTSIARMHDQIAELTAQRTGLLADRREESVARLRDITASIAEIEEKRRALIEQTERLLIRAPVSGTILELAIDGPGAVVAPGAELLRIVPDDTDLIVEARIDPYSRDQIWIGQTARIMFPGLPQRTTPQLTADVTYIGADAIDDPRTGETYYQVDLTISAAEKRRLLTSTYVTLAPGMPVEAFIANRPRTVASYLLQPLTDNFRRALREE